MYDVVIVGAGPVGLFLACELRLAGLSVVVLEREGDPHSPLKWPPFGMRGLSITTIEAFYRRGLLDDIAGAQTPYRQAGHFAGIPFDAAHIDTRRWPYRLANPAATTRAATMDHIETILAARAVATGVEIRRGIGVDTLTQSEGEVRVCAGDMTFRGRWLVGCDGGRSTVRKAAGFAFVGTDPEFTGYSVQVEMAEPNGLGLGRHYTATGMYFQSQPGIIAMVAFDGGAFHRTQPITREHVQAVLRHISGTDVTLTKLHLATTWTDRTCQATAYRNGRVLLCGDAAHIHSPLGGQGLNLGLGDAMNLGWKLAATLRGVAPAGLLDSYFSERYAVGAHVLDWSRAQVALMRPSPSSRALEAIVRDLIGTTDGATYFAERLWGVSLRYDLGGDHPLIGRSVPDFEWADGMRLGAYLRGGQGVLLNFDRDAGLRAIGHGLAGKLQSLEGAPHDPLGLSAVLVRPDGVVAWACEGVPNVSEAIAALSSWLVA
jgi:2-polyprenyl-6-methoxyphenol hydroxylase-like FAD-dependent oxidoreductase